MNVNNNSLPVQLFFDCDSGMLQRQMKTVCRIVVAVAVVADNHSGLGAFLQQVGVLPLHVVESGHDIGPLR